MPTATRANYHTLILRDTFACSGVPYMPASSHLVFPEQGSDVVIPGNQKNVTPTTTARSEGVMIRVPEDLAVPYDSNNPFITFLKRLRSFRTLKHDWNSYGAAPPNRESRFWARRVLRELDTLNFPPTALSASPDAGVTIFFRSENKQALIECSNNGDIIAVMLEGMSAPKPFPISQDRLKYGINTIKTFLTT
jgi:hypothetical protein